MRKRLFIISSIIIASILIVSVNLFAYESADGTLGLYKFEAKALVFSASYDGGNTWYTVFDREDEGGTVIDIASGSIGERMGSYCTDAVIPTGTITHFKVKVAMGVTIKGWVKSGDTYYYTDPNVANRQTNSTTDLTTARNSCADITMQPPSGQPDMENTQAVSGDGIVVTEGEQINVSIIFNLDHQIRVRDFGGGMVITPQDPDSDPDKKPTITQL